MATKTVVCPECDTPLAPGRLSCSACGALVASVASAVRMFSPAELAVPPVLEPAANPKRRKAIEVRPLPEADDLPLGTMVDNVPPEAEVEADVPEPVDEPAIDPVVQMVMSPEPATRIPNVLAAVEPSWPEAPAWPPQRPPSEPVTQDGAAAGRALAGAYLPPSAVLPPGEALPLSNGWKAATPAIAAAPVATAGAEPNGWSRFGLGEADGLGLPADAPIKIIVGGAGIAAFGFILPWAEIVIGSKAMGSYLDQWGLAGPSHPLVLLGLLVLGGVALAIDRLPRWVSPGLPAIGLGAFLLGLAWPYLTGPFRASIGVYVVVVGALILIVGGLAHRAGRRHEDATASV